MIALGSASFISSAMARVSSARIRQLLAAPYHDDGEVMGRTSNAGRASQHPLPNVAPLLQRQGMSNRRCPPSLLHGVPLLARLVRNEQCPFRQQADCKSSGFLSV